MNTNEIVDKITIPIYDFKDGLVIHRLPNAPNSSDGKRKVIKKDRYVSREFNDELIIEMYRSMTKKAYDPALGIYVNMTTDYEIAFFNSYLKTGVMDKTYNTITRNISYFTPELENELKRLWKEKKHLRKFMRT